MSFSSTAQTYVLNQKLMSIGGDLWIDDAGVPARLPRARDGY
jgi:hypothetical protein